MHGNQQNDNQNQKRNDNNTLEPWKNFHLKNDTVH